MEITIKHTKAEKTFAHNLVDDLKSMKKDYGWKVNWIFKYEQTWYAILMEGVRDEKDKRIGN